MSNKTIFKLFFLLAVIEKAVCWHSHGSIRTGATTMVQGRSPENSFKSTSIPISYNVTYTSNINSQPSGSAVSFLNFKTGVSVSFSVNTTIQLFTQSSLRLTFKVFGDTNIMQYTVNWIVIGVAATFSQVFTTCHLCTVLNTGRGLRTQTKTAQSMFIGGPNVYITSFLSSFVMNNGQGLSNYLQISANLPSASKTISYTFKTNQNNTVSSLCFGTIIYDQDIGLEHYFNYGYIGQSVLKNQGDAQPPFPTESSPAHHKGRDRTFHGISYFNVSRAMNRLFEINSLDYQKLKQLKANEYNHSHGTYQIRVNYYYISVRGCNKTNKQWYFVTNRTNGQCIQRQDQGTASCDHDYGGYMKLYPSNGHIDGDPNYCAPCHYTCYSCSGALENNCDSCSWEDFRNKTTDNRCVCLQTYVHVGITRCYPCSTFLPGCKKCQNVLMCEECDTGFTRTSLGICECTNGHMVSGQCTNITGCITQHMFNGQSLCVQCNGSLKFQLDQSNYNCVCQNGYQLQGDMCLSVCGDGVRVSEEGCDDGNVNDGDGCNSECKVQDGWICSGGDFINKDTCLIDVEFQIKIKYIRRVTNDNALDLVLSITPVFQRFSKFNFKRALSHNISSQDFSVSYTEGVLSLRIPYTESIEGKSFNLNLAISQLPFVPKNISKKFVAKGMNSMLTFDSHNSVIKPLQIITIILSVLAILVALSSTVSQKMIGIETIQTFQMVHFGQNLIKKMSNSFVPLQMLRYSSGWNQVQGTDYSRTYTIQHSFARIGLEKQFLLSYNFMYAILLAVVVLCLLLKLKLILIQRTLSKSLNQEDVKQELKYSNYTKVFNFIFERIFFVIIFLNMFLIVFGLMVQMRDEVSDYNMLPRQFNLLSAIIATAILMTTICGVILNGCFPQTLLFPTLTKAPYAPVYFLFQTTCIFLLAFNNQTYTLYIVEGLSALYIMYIFVQKPYHNYVHSFILIVNQLTVMTSFGIYLYLNLSGSSSQNLHLILNSIILFLLLLTLILNGYRVWEYWHFLRERGWNQYGFDEFELDHTQYQMVGVNGTALGSRLPMLSTRSPIARESDLKLTKQKPSNQKSSKNKQGSKERGQFKEADRGDRGDRADRGQGREKKLRKSDKGQNINWQNNQFRDEGDRFDATPKVMPRVDAGDSVNKGKIGIEEQTIHEVPIESFESPYDQNGYVKPSERKLTDNKPTSQNFKKKIKYDLSSKTQQRRKSKNQSIQQSQSA